MERTFFDYLELAARAFDLHDHRTAALELEKALELITPAEDPKTSAAPFATDIWSELKKAVDALAISEFSVSSLCLSKALRKVRARNLDQTVALTDGARIVDALRQVNLPSVASNLRHAANLLDFQGRVAVGSRLQHIEASRVYTTTRKF